MKDHTNDSQTGRSIFITGSSSVIGSQLINQLKDQYSIRTGTPALDREKKNHDVEQVAFSFNDQGVMENAFRDIQTLFLLTGNTPTFDRQVNMAIQAARNAGVKHVIRLSTLGLASNPNDSCMMMHRKGEEYVRSSGLTWTILKPNHFMDNIIGSQSKSILEHFKFYGSAGQGKVSFISSADISACAANIIADPESHHSKTYRLTGPEALSYYQVADILSEILGKKVNYINISSDQLAEGLRANGMADWLIDSMISTEGCVKEGKFSEITDDVKILTGRPSEHLQSFLNREFMEGHLRSSAADS